MLKVKRYPNKMEIPKDWLYEFKIHFYRFSEQLQIKVKNMFNEYNDEPGLFSFAQFWFKAVFNWTGILDPELVYMTVKALVLAGLTEKAKIIGRGYYHHAGCLAWLIGAYNYGFQQKSNEKLHLIESVNQLDLENPNWNNDTLLNSEISSWKLIFSKSQEIVKIFESKRNCFVNNLPFYILIDKLIKSNQLKLTRYYLNQSIKIQDDRILHLLLLQKEAEFYLKTGDHDKALLFFEIAIDLAKELFDFITLAKIYFNLSVSYFHQNNYLESLVLIEKAEKNFRFVNDQIGLGKVYFILCSLYYSQGNYIKAENAIDIAHDYLKHTPFVAINKSIQVKKAEIKRVQGDYNTALEIYEETITPKVNIVNIEQIIQLSLLYFELGQYHESLLFLERSFQLCKKIGYIRGISEIELRRGQLLLYQGNLSKAKLKFEKSNDLYCHLNHSKGQNRSQENLAFIDILSGDFNTAESKLLINLDRSRQQQDYLEEISSLNLLSEVQMYLKNYEKAEILLTTAGRMLKQRKIKNFLFFNNLLTKVKLYRTFSPYSISLFNAISNLNKLSLNTGVKTWKFTSILLEADSAISKENYKSARKLCKSVITLDNKINFDIKIQSKLILIKSYLCELNSKIFPEDAIINSVEKLLIELIEECLIASSKICLFVAKLNLVIFFLIKNDFHYAKNEYNSLLELINETQMFFFRSYLNELKSLLNLPSKVKKSINLELILVPSFEVNILNILIS